MRLCFLTLEDRAGFFIDDAIAIAELARRGHDVVELPWRTSGVQWTDFAGVVVRTTWDYQRDLPGFLALLDRITALGVPLANSAALVRWNARKTYLRDLAGDGVTIVPTRFGAWIDAAGVLALPAMVGAAAAVLKPEVGANADDTFVITPDLSAERAAVIAARFAGRGWLAQPFVDGVLGEGEYSLFYFFGELSHAIVKRPRPGDFRVQEEHGASIDPVVASADLRDAAGRVMSALAERWRGAPLQARVDLVRLADGEPALMELEAVEPALYFRTDPGAAARFADALEVWLGRAHVGDPGAELRAAEGAAPREDVPQGR